MNYNVRITISQLDNAMVCLCCALGVAQLDQAMFPNYYNYTKSHKFYKERIVCWRSVTLEDKLSYKQNNLNKLNPEDKLRYVQKLTLGYEIYKNKRTSNIESYGM